MKRLLFAITLGVALSAPSLHSSAAPAGTLVGIGGRVQVLPVGAQGPARVLRTGDPFEDLWEIQTDALSRAELRFLDGKVLVLHPNTRVVIEQYQYDPANPRASRSQIRLLNGALRFTGGQLAAQNSEADRLFVGRAQISIASAAQVDLEVAISNGGGPEIGAAVVRRGAVLVVSPYGRIERIGPNQTGLWEPGAARTVPFAALPAGLQAELRSIEVVTLTIPTVTTTGLTETIFQIPETPRSGGGCTGSPC